MLPEGRKTTHPGEILLREFLEPLQRTPKALAEHLGLPSRRINELVRGKRRVTPDTAWMLSQAFGTSPEFWMGLQVNYDLSSSRPTKAVKRLVA
jgi:antitoxin HigA-1